MNKFYGRIGFAEMKETSPRVYEEVFQEKKYFGDVLSNQRRWTQTENLNDNVGVQMRISIVANSFAYANWKAMRYVEYLGVLWKINSAEIAYPRIILNIGEVYNGQTAGTGSDSEEVNRT